MARAWAAITRSSPRARASWTSRAAARAAPSRSPATGSSRRLTSLPDHVAKNRAYWERTSDAYQERHGRQLAEKAGLAWGVWQVPEAELNELGPPQNATTTYDFVALDWARRWPAENIWKALKRRAADK